MKDVIVIGGGQDGVKPHAARALNSVQRSHWSNATPRRNLRDLIGCVPARVLAEEPSACCTMPGGSGSMGSRASVSTLDFARLLTRTRRAVYTLHTKKQLHRSSRTIGRDGLRRCQRSTLHRRTERTLLSLAMVASASKTNKFMVCAAGHAQRLPLPGRGARADAAMSCRSRPGLSPSSSWANVATGSSNWPRSSPPSIASGAARSGAAPDAAGGPSSFRRPVRAAFEQRGVQVITGISGSIEDSGSRSNVTLHYGHHDGAGERSKQKRSLLQPNGFGQADVRVLRFWPPEISRPSAATSSSTIVCTRPRRTFLRRAMSQAA